MKHLKILGLGIVTALALTALAGVGIASATTLCSVNTSPCPATSTYPAGTHVEATSANSVLTTTGGFVNPVVTCTHSVVTGTTTNSHGASITGQLQTFTFNGCTTGGGAKCTATGDTGNILHVTATGGGGGTLTETSGGGTFACENLPKCAYITASATLSVKGGNPATITANKILLTRDNTRSEFGCPPHATWSATYTVVTPSPLFVPA